MHRVHGKDAALTVTVDDNGYKLTLRASGSGSSGVDRMTLFRLDLTLLEEGISTAHHPDFLVHDSTVFDGVDPRQRSGALRFAQKRWNPPPRNISARSTATTSPAARSACSECVLPAPAGACSG